MSWLTDLIDLGAEVEPAVRVPYAFKRRAGDVVAFERHRAPTATDKPGVGPGTVGAWIVGGFAVSGAVLAVSMAVFGVSAFLDRASSLWAYAFERLVMQEHLRWLLAPMAAAALIVAMFRHRRRPREIVFDPGPREVRIVPGRSVPFADISGIHSLAFRDLTGEEPVERYRVYLRLGDERIMLSELPSKQEADDLATELKHLVGSQEMLPGETESHASGSRNRER